jgi:hypothetical protein
MKSLFVLSLVLITTACGPLSKEKMAEFDRINEETAQRNNPTLGLKLKVSTLNYDSTGTLNLAYSVTHLNEAKSFVIQLTRSNGLTNRALLILNRGDDWALYDTLMYLFADRVAITSAGSSSSQVLASMLWLNGDRRQILNPGLITSVPNTNRQIDLLESLNRFILNRL